MLIAVIYVYPNLLHRVFNPLAKRFTQTYCDHPSATDHELYVAVNGGGEPTASQRALFHPLVPKFFLHDNSARDIGAYLVAAQTIDCDLLVCLGAPLRINRDGWLDRINQAYQDNGPGLYGFWAFSTPSPHIRTTAFFCPPQLLNSYPHPVTTADRYGFEHGQQSITRWCMKQGLPVLQITWSGVYAEPDWHMPEKDDSLVLDQHREREGI